MKTEERDDSFKVTARTGFSEWVACCPSFFMKAVKTSQQRECFLRSLMKLSHGCFYLPAKTDFIAARITFPITIMNETIYRAFLISLQIVDTASQA
jgi:hypothetical protein